MPTTFRIICENTELALEAVRAAEALGVTVDPKVIDKPRAADFDAEMDGWLVSTAPPVSSLVERARLERLCVCVANASTEARISRQIANDLGLPATDEVEPFLSSLVATSFGGAKPWNVQTRHLPETDRARLKSVLAAADRHALRIMRFDDRHLGLSADGAQPVCLGRPRDVALALASIRDARTVPPAATTPWPGSGLQTEVREVLFGPARDLSDPTSKAALRPYGVPLPIEELCASPSRAASEAARIGFPVRIALASPDLRVWDHPDLAVDGIDNAARVRDVYRQVTGLAKLRAPEARLLGVTVMAAAMARAFLRVRMTPVKTSAGTVVLTEVGFADPHGAASDDRIYTLLPAPEERIESALGRFRGHPLLRDGHGTKNGLQPLVSVLDRLGQFTAEQVEEIRGLEVHPLAILLGGGIEIREACVRVGDAFTQALG